MKLQNILIIVICIGIINAKTNIHKKNRKSARQSGSNLTTPDFNGGYALNSFEPKHISETFYGGNPNTLPADRGFLWKGYDKKQFAQPYYHGVVGPQWRVPPSDLFDIHNHISSPTPQADFSHRIIAHDLPANTHSHDSFELPKRSDVVQIDIPYSATHTRERYSDARFPPKLPVKQVTGTQYHGTKSVNAAHNFANNMEPTAANPQTVDSMYSFAEKTKKSNKKKSHLRKNKKWVQLKDTDVKSIKQNSLSEALDAEKRAFNLLNSMTPHPEMGNGSMVLDIESKNKRDIAFGLHHDNPARKKYIDYISTQEQGVRAMNIKPFMPPVSRDNTRVVKRNRD